MLIGAQRIRLCWMQALHFQPCWANASAMADSSSTDTSAREVGELNGTRVFCIYSIDGRPADEPVAVKGSYL